MNLTEWMPFFMKLRLKNLSYSESQMDTVMWDREDAVMYVRDKPAYLPSVLIH